MIPKTCHFIWTKTSPMSWVQTLSPYSFKKHNPDWDIIIHLIGEAHGANTYIFEYTGDDFFGRLSNDFVIKEVDLDTEGIGKDRHGMQASDSLRMKVLHDYGGVFSDFDMIWIKPLPQFDFETSVCYYTLPSPHYNMSNIISEVGGGFLCEILYYQGLVTPPYSHQAFLTDLLGKVYFSPQIIKDKFPRVMFIPHEWFYPYSVCRLEELYFEDTLSPIGESFGVHWFNGHELSKDYINKQDYRRKCSMTSLLKKEGYL